MVRIMLACSAGMSTSLLVTKMQAAAEQKGIEAKIWAISESNIDKELGNFDVLLLGPQVRFMLEKVKTVVNGQAPVEVINMAHYGMCNGPAVLDRALELAGK